MDQRTSSEAAPDSNERSSLTREQRTTGASPNEIAGADAVADGAPEVVLAVLLLLGVLGALGGAAVPAAAKPAKTAAAALVARPTDGARAAPAASVEPDKERVTVSHLVVTYKDTLLGQHEHVTRTREEARQRALEALARARKGEDFAKLVAEYSDEPGAAARKGAVGRMARKFAVKGFEKAFDLKVGEISELVETQFGFHVIWRTE